MKEIFEKAEQQQLELPPPPDAPPGEDLEPPEQSPDPRATGKRKGAAPTTSAEPVGEDAPHFADWFSSRGSLDVGREFGARRTRRQ